MSSCDTLLILTPDLLSLLGFIRGEGHHYGMGIMTKEHIPEMQEKHSACLKLEQLGLIQRHFEDALVVVWIPVEAN